MKNGLDIFGNALLSYLSGNRDATLLVHTEGVGSYDIPVSIFFRPADYYPVDQYALTLCKGKVLDIGAGVGEHSMYLQNIGLDVTALDISSVACDIMRKRGISSVINQDIFNGKLDSHFDSWLLLGRSIGMVGTAPNLLTFLRLAKQNLSDTGQVILNSVNGVDEPVTRKISFEFLGEESSTFEWLDIDSISLEIAALACGFSTEIIRVENDDHYLAVLRKLNYSNALKSDAQRLAFPAQVGFSVCEAMV
ncbi:class I SAM-dependent methyltransferase [Vibrio hepatarius]|uniref:class I SAM-dependent methyltransferase n=1 Tax=Vibrio hepatarius TaxID=171383 RepID=UPI00142D7EC4|nr:methyltransferase domain-containing protein [Vibrio hepatarius]NIY83682.1 SAM-dependent methyltransferase [Vibrio hepatarius]